MHIEDVNNITHYTTHEQYVFSIFKGQGLSKSWMNIVTWPCHTQCRESTARRAKDVLRQDFGKHTGRRRRLLCVLSIHCSRRAFDFCLVFKTLNF